MTTRTSAKRLIGAIILVCCVGSGIGASPPERMNFQGVLRDNAGIPVGGTQSMVFRLYEENVGCPGGGTLLLADDHASVTLAGGLFNVALGAGTVTAGTASSLRPLFRDHAEVWVEIEVAGETLCPRVRVESAAYAQMAGGLLTPDYVGIGTTAPAHQLHVRETSTNVAVFQSASVTNSSWIWVENLGVSGGFNTVGLGSNGDDLLLRAGDTEKLRVTGSGDVGIGTGVPGAKLDVVGAARISGQLTVEGGGPAPGRVLTTDGTGLATWEDPQPGPAGPEGPVGSQGPAGPPGGSASPVHSRTEIDALGDVGDYNAIAIGVDGFPVLSYYDATADQLKAAHCDDPACATVTTTTLTNFPQAGSGTDTDIAVGADGFPVISFRAGGLGVFHCSDESCTGGTLANNVAAGGSYSSIAIGTDGFPIISHSDTNSLFMTHCEDIGCSDSSTTSLDTGGVGEYSSITIDADGFPIVSYYDRANDQLKVADCLDTPCTSAVFGYPTTFATGVAGTSIIGTSITVTADGSPLIAFATTSSGVNWSLQYVQCVFDSQIQDSCVPASPTTNLIDSGPWTPTAFSLAVTVGADGRPLIAYHSLSQLRVARANQDDVMTTWRVNVLFDGLSEAGRHVSITVGTDGLPIVGFWTGFTSSDIQTIHCSNRFCLPFHRAW